MTLALLITAASGAWADEVKYPIVYDFEAAANAGENPVNKNGSEVNGQKFYGWENETYTDRERKDYKGYEYAEGSVLPEVCHVWRRSDRMDASASKISNGGLQCPNNREMAVDGLTEGLTVTIIYDATNATDKEIVWAIGDGSSQSLGEPRAKAIINGAEAVAGTTTIKSGDVITVTKVTPAANGSGYIVFKVKANMVIKKIIIDEAKAAEPDVEVTTNAAEEGATFTEATFAMPAFDATAEYELVRDMGIQMTATMGDGTDGVRYRVKKAQQGGGYEPADLNMMQVLALVAVNDGIEQKALTLNQDYYCRIYKLDEQTLQPEGDGVELVDFDFAPGLYALKAVAKDGSNYDGETALSNTFKLFQGYEITVPAGEFVTYYKDEPLRIEDQEADLYTIQSVSADQAVLSSPSDAMPSNTPMLVYNKSNETKVILLIPCAEPDMAITVAPEFQGTLTGTTIAASTENVTNYAFNGKQFVFVKNAIEVGPNKCWISVPSDISNVKALRIVFGGDATGIRSMDNGQWTMDNWYDLNGRKLNGMPTKRGIYVKNGRKVVVK